MTLGEWWFVIRKAFGTLPTTHLIRWSPTFRNPFHYDLLEVDRCETDGMVVTRQVYRSPVGLHAGHKMKSPKRYSLWELLLVQLRVIR